MSSIKITTLLALVSTVAAVPHFQHGRFHQRAYGYNTTIVSAGATGTYDDKTTTVETTSTSTQTIYSTVWVKPSSSTPVPVAEAVSSVLLTSSAAAECGGTVTVTAHEQVTVTVTPGADVPASSSAAVSSSSPAVTPVEASSTAQTPVAETTTSAAPYSAVTPKASSSSAAVSSSAITPQASSSSAAVYSSVAVPNKPVVSASSTSSAPATTSTAASSGNTYTGTKRGLAYNDAALCSSFGSKFGFGYNWGQTESSDIGTQFIPMMHAPSTSTAEEWLANVDAAVKKGSTAVMGFNECDQPSQCNLEPAAACASWKTYMNPVKTAHSDVTIIGPSISNGQAPQGLDWLTRFKSACPEATIDASNMHFYDNYDSTVMDRFKAQIDSVSELYGLKVWITEFGLNTGTATDAEAASFLKEAVAYLDSCDKVQGYSYFMVGTGQYQLNSGSGLSSIGEVYASA